jgi:hypothetical protein
MMGITQIINADGSTTIVDNRIFSIVVENQIESFKMAASNDILKLCPEFKQRNAAMGLLSVEETEYITNTIQNIRNKCNFLEQEVLKVVWDGTEENRSAACDAVQAIYWSSL